MGFLDRIGRAVNSALDELKKPESFVKGEDFEKYVREYMFPDSDYELIYQTSSYSQNKDRFATDSMKPDFLFMDRKTKKQFYVECKYRSDEYRKDEKLEWTYPEQLKRYKEVSKDIPVFIALGIQGTSYDPDFIFLIPLKNVSFCGFYDSFLSKYEFYKRKPVFPSYLGSLEDKI